jgi:hypothetical protein
MNSILTNARLALAALAIAAAPVSFALAESNNDPSGLETSNLAVVSNPVEVQTGSNAFPHFNASSAVGVETGGVVALAGSQSEPQPVNAMPHALTASGSWTLAQAGIQQR